MPLLYFWRGDNYRRDLDFGAGFHLNQSNPLLHDIERGDRSLVEELRRLYEGRCQFCGWEPRLKYRAELCEAHHVRWLSRGGEDAIGNLVLVCPNHHRAIHECDAPFDHERTAFVFPTNFEPLTLRLHRLAAD